MKIINAGYQIINEPNITKKIERIARVCYKSEDKIDEGTDLKMINALMRRQHTAMLEHASIVLTVDRCTYNYLNQIRETMETCCTDKVEIPENCYLRFTYTPIQCDKNMITHRYVVSGNVRAWYHFLCFANSYGYGIPITTFSVVNNAVNHIFDRFKNNVGVKEGCKHFFNDELCEVGLVIDFSKLTDKERLIHEDVSVLFTVDRGVTHELVRHRDCSFAQESTRYCNYSFGKFGNEITVIKPCFYEEHSKVYEIWKEGCRSDERTYFELLNLGATPQQARDNLPPSIKADIVMTTNLREWKHIFNLRACDATGSAHPQMKEVMVPLLKEIRPKYEFAFGDLYVYDEVHS